MSTVNQIVNKYVQHSKKLANWGLLQWIIIISAILIILSVHPIEDNTVSIIEKIVVWSATLAGVTVTGYMGNSSVEKYAEKKFALVSSTEESDIEELEQG